MAYDRFLIAPIKSGLITANKAWQIPEDAFAAFKNSYIHRGIVRKRFGSALMGASPTSTMLDQLNSRLRYKIGTTNGAGALSGTVPGSNFTYGQMFSIGTEILTVPNTGEPVTLLTTGASTTHTYNTTTGAYVFAGAALTTDVYFYPAQPVMGITQLNTANLAANTTYAFDRQFIYKFNGTSWVNDGTTHFHGDDADFFNAANWLGLTANTNAMFVTNFHADTGTPGANDDPMYVYRQDTGTWTEFRPICATKVGVPGTVDRYVQTCRIIVPFKNRLLLLNTIERNITSGKNEAYSSRCRFSANLKALPAPTSYIEADISDAWLEPNNVWTIGGTTKYGVGAGWVDAPTSEEIVSAAFIKDRLIVYFEESTYEIAYTGNKELPFEWQKINSELGTKSLNAPVVFDKAILNVGLTGVHSCTGANVSKINDKIVDFTFGIRKSDYGQERITGIRDYTLDVVYWAYPSTNSNKYADTFNDKILVYNYQDDAWAIFDDCITAFGYCNQQVSLSWDDIDNTWEEVGSHWNEGTLNEGYRQVIAGNQQGFVYICSPDIEKNEPTMQLSDLADAGDGVTILGIVNHNLNVGDVIKLVDIGSIGIDSSINYRVLSVTNEAIITINSATYTGGYLGGGRVGRVSRIDISTKQFNFYINKGKNFFLAKTDFAVMKTSRGKITVDYFPSDTYNSMISQATATGTQLGTNVLETSPYTLYPLEAEQNRLWHTIYYQTEGECIQVRLYLSDDQLLDQAISESDFRLEGFVLHGKATSSRLQ